jgi:hypothetical protein
MVNEWAWGHLTPQMVQRIAKLHKLDLETPGLNLDLLTTLTEIGGKDGMATLNGNMLRDLTRMPTLICLKGCIRFPIDPPFFILKDVFAFLLTLICLKGCTRLVLHDAIPPLSIYTGVFQRTRCHH